MKKTLLSLVIILLLSTTFLNSVSTVEKTNYSSTEYEASINVETSSKEKIGRAILKLAFKIISYNSDRFFYKSPTHTRGPSRDTVSSGNISFNDKYGSGYGAVVDKEVEVVKGGHQVEMWANSKQLFWSGKISVVLRDPNGIRRINRSVGHNQYSWYEVPISNTGRYIAEYISNNKDTWNLWLAYYHFGYFNYNCTDNGYCIIPANSGNGSKIKAVNADGTETVFEDREDKRYMVPSKKHLENNVNSISNNKLLSFKDLHDQFYDKELKTYVDVAKNLIVGDSVIVSDLIEEIEYDKDNDVTLFGFYFNNNEIDYIGFSGDLTKEYSKGDQLELQFKILPSDSKGKYVALDYNIEVEKYNAVPHIENYLLEDSDDKFTLIR